jgi:O-antigen ligase
VVAVLVLLVLAAAAGLRVGSDQASPDAILRAAVLLGAGLLAARRDRVGVGVSLLPAVGAGVPIAIGTGTQSSVVAALALVPILLAFWATGALISHDLRIARSPVNAPAMLLVVVWGLALLNGDVERDPLVSVPPTWTVIQLGALAVTAASCAALWLALNAGRDARRIELAAWSFLAVGALAGAGFYLGMEAWLPFLQTGGLFTMWVVALAYGQALFNAGLRWWARAGLGLLAAAWLYKALVLQTAFFSGWAAPLLAALVITFVRSRLAGAGLSAVAGLAIGLNWDVVYDAVYGGAEAKGDLTRLEIWANAWDLFAHHPLLGTGPAGYAVYFQSFYGDTGFALSTHSTYWDVLLQTGLVGAVVFAWLLGSLLLVGCRACARHRSGFVGGYAAAGVGGLAGLVLTMAMGDWFIPFVYNQTIAGFRYTVHSWVFLGFLASLAVTSGSAVQSGARRPGPRPRAETMSPAPAEG